MVMKAGMAFPGPASRITKSGVYTLPPTNNTTESLRRAVPSYLLPACSKRYEVIDYAYNPMHAVFMLLLQFSAEAISEGQQLCVKSQGKCDQIVSYSQEQSSLGTDISHQIKITHKWITGQGNRAGLRRGLDYEIGGSIDTLLISFIEPRKS